MAILENVGADPDLETAVRNVLTRLVRRVGVWVALVGFLVAVLVTNPPLHQATGTPAGTSTPTGQTVTATAPAGSAAPNATAPGSSTSPPGSAAAVGSVAGGGSSASAAAGSAGSPSSVAPAAAPGVGSGISRAGVRCGPGVRQLPGAAYGAACEAAFTGANGGATSPGVTATTVTVTLRIGSSGESAALMATGGTATDSLGGQQQAVAADAQTLVAYFNKVFELYGRHVALKTFNGQGDFLAEFQGQDISGAEADAARARDLGSFADISLVTMTQPYAEALISNRIVAMSPIYLSENWLATHAPYSVGLLWPAGTVFGQFVGNTVCERLAGRPASFAGPGTQGKPRVFGIINPENPEYAAVGDRMTQVLAGCGVKVARRVAYALNIATLQEDDTNAIAQLKAAGVTTILCACDEFSPIFLSRAADSQDYYPEWFAMAWPDPWGRLATPDQWAHAIFSQGTTPNYAAGEAGRVFRAASGGAAPQSPQTLQFVYEQLLGLFSAIQDAGPSLTPQSFQAGFSTIPSTASGDFGPWTFAPGVLDPRLSFQIGSWNATAPSNLDGHPGSIQSCSGGTWFRYDDPAQLGPPGAALGCTG